MAGDYTQAQKYGALVQADVDILTGTASYNNVIVPKSANHQVFLQKITLSITTHVAGDVYRRCGRAFDRCVGLWAERSPRHEGRERRRIPLFDRRGRHAP